MRLRVKVRRRVLPWATPWSCSCVRLARPESRLHQHQPSRKLHPSPCSICESMLTMVLLGSPSATSRREKEISASDSDNTSLASPERGRLTPATLQSLSPTRGRFACGESLLRAALLVPSGVSNPLSFVRYRIDPPIDSYVSIFIPENIPIILPPLHISKHASTA